MARISAFAWVVQIMRLVAAICADQECGVSRAMRAQSSMVRPNPATLVIGDKRLDEPRLLRQFDLGEAAFPANSSETMFGSFIAVGQRGQFAGTGGTISSLRL